MEENNNTILKSALVLAVIIASFFGYLYFKEKGNIDGYVKTIESKNQEINFANRRLDSLSLSLDDKIIELQSMGEQVEELERVKAKLEIEKKSLSGSKSVNLREFEAKIKNYEALIAQKEREMATLRDQRDQLTETNTSLNRDNATLQTEKSALRDTVIRYVRENKELTEKVAIGAALRPMGYMVTAINKRGKERDGLEFKSKKVDRVKVAFKLAENPLTKQEVKTIYMRMLNPEGNVINDMALGSGVFDFGGKQTVYTAKQNITYTNNNQPVEFIFDREQKYEKGTYGVELYSEGFRIGQTSFSIK